MKSTRVLLIDDDEAFRELLISVFLEQGCEVAAAERGGEALELAMDCKFDVILADRRLPDMDVTEILRRLRGAGSTVPIVIVSGYAGCLEDGELRKLGATTVLTKPVKINVLLRTVAEILAGADAAGKAMAIPGANGE